MIRRRPLMAAAIIGGGRRRRRRRVLGTVAVASAITHNRGRQDQRYQQQVQQQQIAQQQYEIERLKAEQRARATNQPKVIYVQDPYAAQYVQTQHIQPSAPPANIVYVHSPEGPKTNASVPPAPALSAYNPEAQPLVRIPQQPHIIQQAPHIVVQQPLQAGQLTTEQHAYVQPKQEVYVQRPPETEALIEKAQQQKEEPPPPESKGCKGCCIVM